MAPLRPQPSRASSHNSTYFDATEERQTLQAGRSTANLHAAASAQSLRESSRPANSRAPSLLRKKSRPDEASRLPALAGTQPIPPPLPTGNAAGTSRQPSPRAPESSSPLQPSPTNPSSDSGDSRKNSNESGESSQPSQPSATRSKVSLPPPGTAVSGASTLSGASTPKPYSLRPPINAGESSLSLLGQQTPRSIRELGSDYNRYYNPFSSNNNSQQDLATPLSRYASSTHLIAGNAMSSTTPTKRLSDPFNDEQRTTNPFASAQNTRPSTPDRQDSARSGKPVMLGTAVAGGAGGAGYFSEKTAASGVGEVDPEKAEFFPYMDDRLGAPEYAFPLFTDAVEDDDDLHMPQWDDDIKLKPSWREHFTRETIASTIGMVFMTLGLLVVFVVLPVISFTSSSLIKYSYETPLNQMPGYGDDDVLDKTSWMYVSDRKHPLMQNMRSGLIDPDTPDDASYRTDINGKRMELVFSDEFNDDNRTFYPGDDPYWYAPDFWYGATMDLEWYDPDAVNTGDGVLQLQLDEFRSHNLDFRSGMLHSWNQLCFKGGVFEISASLPGPAGIHGLWPGAWTMGNLGRPGYLATTDGVWPYTYNTCDSGITPNQSHTDGLSKLPGQKLASCTCPGADHPSPGTGRGAPEIDILEVSADWGGLGLGVATQSYQVAPFDLWWYPNAEFMETPDYSLSFVNTYTGGPFQQAVSTTTMLNNTWYDGQAYQKYAFEYAPGGDEDAYIAWFVGDTEMMKFDARAIGPNGNVAQRLVSEEPMTIVINLGISENWVDILWDQLSFPTVMRVDYVRLYQREGGGSVGCDPVGWETTEYIKSHPAAYGNANFTHWEEAGYQWPANELVGGCGGGEG